MEQGVSLPHSQETAVCPYPEQDQPSGYIADIFQRQEHFKGAEATNILGLTPSEILWSNFKKIRVP